MNETEETNLEIQKQNQNEVRELEEFYATGKLDNLLANIEEKKDQVVQEMIEFAENHKVPIKFDDFGDPIAFKINVNPLVVNNYFFKSINPISSTEFKYNAEKLSMVYDYYCFLISEVNDKIGNVPSSLTSFCRFAGITLATLRQYKNSDDLNMRIITEKIYDQIGDENLMMSQMGVVRERSTIFKMKSQNEMVEKQQPNININITEQPDMAQIQERINKYKIFSYKKEK